MESLATLRKRDIQLKLVFVIVMAIWPLLLNNAYALSVMTMAGLYATMVIGLGLLLGQAGQLSFGHTAFFGIGAYTSALLTTRLGVPTLAALVASAIVAGVVALIIGRPVLRLRFFFLALATIGLGQVFVVFVRETRWLTGGSNGIGGIPPLDVVGLAVGNYFGQYYVAWLMVFAMLLFTERALASRAGRAFQALASSEIAASTLGVKTADWKLVAFIVSGVYAGIGGSLHAFTIGAINPNDFTFNPAVIPMIMMLVGGDKSLWGGMIGAILMMWVGRGISNLPEYTGLIHAVVLILLLLFLPNGIVGGLRPEQREWLPSRLRRMERRKPRPVLASDGFESSLHSAGIATVEHDRQSAVVLEPSGGLASNLPRLGITLPKVGRTPGAELLRVEGVSVTFGGLQAVNQVSLSVREGHIAAVIGPNGAGKTTLFNVISGLQRPTAGRVWFAGQEITSKPPADIARLGTARTFQNLRIFGNMSVLENVLVGRHRHEKSGYIAAGLGIPSQRREERESRDRALEVLSLVELEEYASRPAASLPYGQQRLVEIARALATEPRLVLLDEPAAGMNATERAHLIDRIARIREAGVTVLLVEHDVELVMGISDNVSVLDYGKLIAEGKPEEVQKNPAVIEAYLGVNHGGAKDRFATVAVAEPTGAVSRALLAVEDVSTCYGSIEAIRSVSVVVPPKEIVAVLGANGAGKTTLLNTISGILRPRGGCVSYEGVDITHLPVPEIVARGICQVPEGRQVFHSLSVEDNLRLGACRRRNKAEIADALAFVYELFPILADRRRQPSGTLSGGEQQMLAIGRAMMGRPKLLLLDEPSMGLAPLVVERIFEALVKLNRQGLTMLMVEQNAEMALSVAHRAVVLQTGQVALAGPAAELRRDDRVRGLYLGQGQSSRGLLGGEIH